MTTLAHGMVTVTVMPPRIVPRVPVRVYLAEWRVHLGLTQQEVADGIAGGIPNANISRWENEKRVPSIDVLAAYAEALKIPVANLYRLPSARPSLDEIIANASPDIQDKAVSIVKILAAPST